MSKCKSKHLFASHIFKFYEVLCCHDKPSPWKIKWCTLQFEVCKENIWMLPCYIGIFFSVVLSFIPSLEIFLFFTFFFHRTLPQIDLRAGTSQLLRSKNAIGIVNYSSWFNAPYDYGTARGKLESCTLQALVYDSETTQVHQLNPQVTISQKWIPHLNHLKKDDVEFKRLCFLSSPHDWKWPRKCYIFTCKIGAENLFFGMGRNW